MAKNKVIAGDYLGSSIGEIWGSPYFTVGIFKTMNIDKSNVECYELLDAEKTKSAGSAIGRGLVGGFLLGGVGLLAGGLSAKNRGAYQISVKFKDGKKSLIEVDDKIYKTIIKTLY